MKKDPVFTVGSCVGNDRLKVIPSFWGLDDSDQNDPAGQAVEVAGYVATCLNGEVVYIKGFLPSVSSANLPSCPLAVFSLFSSRLAMNTKACLDQQPSCVV